jgi:hypothetical protein
MFAPNNPSVPSDPAAPAHHERIVSTFQFVCIDRLYAAVIAVNELTAAFAFLSDSPGSSSGSEGLSCGEPLTDGNYCPSSWFTKIKNPAGGKGMRFIPTMLHGVADYIVGIVVVGLPFVLGLYDTPRAVLLVLGIIVILYSLATDYELGAVRFLRIRFHLLLDALFGVAMLMSPWLFEFPVESRWPVYVIGVLALVLTMTTKIRAEGTAATN